MGLPRCLSSPAVTALINACAIFFLVVNVIRDQYSYHDRLVSDYARTNVPDDYDRPRLRGGRGEEGGGIIDVHENGIVDQERAKDDDVSARSSSAMIGPFVPRGRAVALPSIRVSEDEEKDIERSIYGGKGDKPHLGGFTEFDPLGVSPSLWKHMITHYGIKSLLDVGCGRGTSTSWFVLHGLEYVRCVEGSHDAVMQSIIPNREEVVTEHDFSRGPWWPDRTVDAAWAVEFTEHVGRNYQPNYLTAFRKAALIFVTHSNWGGWHHVEVHNDDWWRVRWEAAGFVYSDILTSEARSVAIRDQNLQNLTLDMNEDELYFVGQHIYLNVQVFINPLVASLPEHAHLFAEHGCFFGDNGKKEHVDCSDAKAGKVVTPLPESFKPLILTDDMDKKWLDMIKNFKTSGRKVKNLRNKKKSAEKNEKK